MGFEFRTIGEILSQEMVQTERGFREGYRHGFIAAAHLFYGINKPLPDEVWAFHNTVLLEWAERYEEAIKTPPPVFSGSKSASIGVGAWYGREDKNRVDPQGGAGPNDWFRDY